MSSSAWSSSTPRRSARRCSPRTASRGSASTTSPRRRCSARSPACAAPRRSSPCPVGRSPPTWCSAPSGCGRRSCARSTTCWPASRSHRGECRPGDRLMPAITAPVLVAAALLVVAGASKAADPTMTVGALRALRWPSSPWLVRAGAVAEALVGTLAVVVGRAPLRALVGASYLAFAAFVVVALRAGAMVGSCGCFGREETPPHPVHVVLDLVLAALVLVAVVQGLGAPLDAIADDPGQGVVVAGLSALGTYLAYAVIVELPR